MLNVLFRIMTGLVCMTIVPETARGAAGNTDDEFAGVIGRYYTDSREAWPEDPRPPANAPNVLIWLIDDAGFSQLSGFGGLVGTPTLDRLADQGLRYTNFHATAVCASTRASLLTGRNHHAVGMGAHVKGAKGFPGYNGRIPRSAASIATILRDNGYATWAIGKWDQIPDQHTGPNGPFDYWPSGQGFEHFYGFIAAETDHFHPQLYSDHTPVDPPSAQPDYHLTTDLADRAIAAINSLEATSSSRPFFLYWATGAVHSPHHVPHEYIDRYRGRFDMGWDAAREQILARQKKLGIMPAHVSLPPRPAHIPAWESLSPEAKRMQARQMEAFAAMLEHTDNEFGRILGALAKNGRLDNTLIIVTSDNGASAEGGPEGSYNELRFSNGLENSLALNLKHYDGWGGPEVFNHYSVGWAMAGNTPFKYYKQTVFSGGVRVPAILSWKSGKMARGAIRTQFHHVNDIAPTVLAAVGITQPALVGGVAQRPFDGVSMSYSFDDSALPSPKKSQYFEMWGNRGIWSEGWKAVVNHYDEPWHMSDPHSFDDDRWELYRVVDDINETTDLAALEPGRLRELQQLFDAEARRNQVYPIKGAGDGWQAALGRVEQGIRNANGTYTYFTPGSDRIPEALAPPVANRSHSIIADIVVPTEGAEGVLVSLGGRPAGYTFYVLDGHLAYTHNFMGEEWYELRAAEPLSPGRHRVEFTFDKTGTNQGHGRLLVDDNMVAEREFPRMVPRQAPINETFDVGRDNGSAVSPRYQAPFEFDGSIEKLTVLVPQDQLSPPM